MNEENGILATFVEYKHGYLPKSITKEEAETYEIIEDGATIKFDNITYVEARKDDETILLPIEDKEEK